MVSSIIVDRVVKEYYLYSKGEYSIFDYIFGNIKEKKTVIKALDNVSFSVSHGDIIGIIGKNGAGKSTLLRILSGITIQTSGNIKINGKIESILSLDTQFNNELTGRENIIQHFSLKNISKSRIQAYINEAIEFSNLKEHIDRPIMTYSTGMKSRLAFSCVTTLTPDILIIDETLSVGDVKFSQKAFKRMRDLIKRGKTVLIVSHDLSSIEYLCNKVIWLDKGKIIIFDTPDKVLKDYKKFISKEEEEKLLERFSKKRIENSDSFNFYITEILFLDESDDPKILFHTFEKMKVRIIYKVKSKIKNVSFRILVIRLDNLLIYDNYSTKDGLVINDIDKDGILEIDFDKITFNSGIFRFILETYSNDKMIYCKESFFKVERNFKDSDQPLYYYPEICDINFL